MAQPTTCTQILSELAEQYDRSTLLLAQLEEALQSRASACSTDALDALGAGEDRAGRGSYNDGGSLACELANLHLHRQATGSTGGQINGDYDDNSHVDTDGSDIDADRRPPSSLALRTSRFMHNASHGDAGRNDGLPASAPIVRRAFSHQPIGRSARRTTTIMHNRQESREATQHQLLLMLVDGHRRSSDTNPAATSFPSTHRCLSEPLMAAPECMRRPSLSSHGPLVVNGVSLSPTASFRGPRLSPLQRAESPNRGSHGQFPEPWSVGGVGGGSGSPGVRACPLLRQVRGATSEGAAATASPPGKTAQLDGGVGADNNNTTNNNNSNSGNGGSAAYFGGPPRASECPFGGAASPSRPRLGPQLETCAATSAFEAVGSGLGGAFPPNPLPAACAPLLPAVYKRRPRGCTEYGGWRSATSYIATAASTD